MTRIRDLLREQDGVLRRDQAVECGMSTSAIDRRLADGDWTPVHPRVYRPADRTLDDRGRVRAGALWAGNGATVVGNGAAIWWHMTTDPLTTLRLASGPHGGHTAPEGITMTRRSVPDRVRVDDVWVSRRADTALDAGSSWASSTVPASSTARCRRTRSRSSASVRRSRPAARATGR